MTYLIIGYLISIFNEKQHRLNIVSLRQERHEIQNWKFTIFIKSRELS